MIQSINFSQNFERLKANENLFGICDIYVSKDSKHILYFPLTSLSCEQALARRGKIESSEKYKLVAVEVSYKQIFTGDPDNPKKTGCFRKVEWRDRDLVQFSKIETALKKETMPKVVKQVKAHLEKDSKWLCGGPKPSEEYVKKETI